MYLFKLHRLLNETNGEPEGGTPRPTPNPRMAHIAQLAQQHNAAIAPDFEQFDEGTGQVFPNEPRVEPPADEADTPSVATPAATEPAPKTRKIIVHGQEIEVAEDRIIESGIRTLQKETAADKLLQEAAEKRRQAEEMFQRAQQRLSNPDAAQHAPSHEDAQPSQPSARTHDDATLDQKLEVMIYNREAQRAARMFEQEFQDIASDPVLRGYAAQLENERLAHVAAVGEPVGDPVDAYRKHGETVRKWLQERTGTKPTVPQDKQERKRSITAVPAANATAPKPDAKKQPTREEVIEGMRIARQGRPVMRTQRI